MDVLVLGLCLCEVSKRAQQTERNRQKFQCEDQGSVTEGADVKVRHACWHR